MREKGASRYTGKLEPGLPVSERTLRAFGHHRRSKKGASLRKEGPNFAERVVVTSAKLGEPDNIL
jgi:hypothetical protein